MGAFLFSTKNFDVKKGLNYFENVGFETSYKIKNDNYSLFVYNKLLSNIKDYNYYKSPNGNFIISSGTIFYNNLFGSEALKHLLNDFSCSNKIFRNIEEKIIGHYFILIYKNNRIYFFNDRGSTYKVYIHIHNNGSLIISSSFIAVLKMLKKKTLQKQEMYEYIFISAVYGYKSFVKEIDLLDGNKIGIYNKNNIEFENKPKFIPLKAQKNIDKTAEFFFNELNEYMVPVKKYFDGSIASELTGGLDTRLIACMLKRSKINHVFSHFISNNSDYNIAKIIAKNEEKDLIVSQTSKSNKLKNLSDYKKFLLDYTYLFDFMNFLVGFNKSDFETFYEVGNKCNLIIGGQSGEIFTSYDFLIDPNAKVSGITNSLIQFSRTNKNIFKNRNGFKDFVKNFKTKISNILNIKNKFLSNFEKNLFRPLILSKSGDSTYISYANNHIFFLSPFADAQISFNTLNMPIKDKINRKFTLKLIKLFNKQLASYPFCSHIKNEGSSLLEIKELVGKKSIRKKILNYLPINIVNYFSYLLRSSKVLPDYLQDDFLSDLFNHKKLKISKFINPKYSKNVGVLNCIYTLELLIREYNIEL